MPNWTGNVAILNFLSPSKSAISFTISRININKKEKVVTGIISVILNSGTVGITIGVYPMNGFRERAVIKKTIADRKATVIFPTKGIRFKNKV